MSEYFVLDGHKAVAIDDPIKWAQEFSKVDMRRVAETEKDGVRVSTVFLGLNHSFGDGPLLLFETMIFGGKHDEDMDRYTTWEQAEEGHRRMCEVAFEV